ncbi:polyprenyl synthetase family protein [Salinarchaeum sp. IM2453]|uniref:polyprenyl synthetase family protein n=1 Tax=Salinarchaeum sp. IM2453 TaxID=2862870 RepID=UPI001C8398C0|nr:polyprenyl synthetase family protein [Salinarchaeum sp. IM2453]QZA87811.1 polyprenyl synthetase family protein [Salinarchaeum sp. IM2453]
MTDIEAQEPDVIAEIKHRRELVNEAIPEYLPIKPPENLYEASRYLLEAGGKRLRPTMLLLVAEALAEQPDTLDYQSVDPLQQTDVASTVGTTQSDSIVDAAISRSTDSPPNIDVMAAAVSVEIIQSFTLIHDDIMDDDDLRRGVPAVHREYDLETAILAGDTLYAKAFELMLETGATSERMARALDVLARTCTEICEGQALDVAFERSSDVSVEDYMKMVRQKTAVLYGASACIPAVLLGADDDTVESLYHYGLKVGQGFQIQDDLLDLTVPSDVLGKQRGSDLIENKRTIVTLHAEQQGVDVDDLVESNSVAAVTEEEIDDALETLRSTGSISFAREQAQELIAEGQRHLEVLPENESRAALNDIADYLINRGY